MQTDNGVVDMVAEPRSMEIEEPAGMPPSDAMLLPVHLPHTGGEAASGAMPAEVCGLLAAIRRIEGIVDEETIALESGKKVDFDDFSIRKSRSMLELIRLTRTRIQPGGEAQIAEDGQRLRRKLERNRVVLEMHHAAVREVATIIARAIEDAESDGTYSARVSQENK
jgi:hypothetical protein